VIDHVPEPRDDKGEGRGKREKREKGEREKGKRGKRRGGEEGGKRERREGKRGERRGGLYIYRRGVREFFTFSKPLHAPLRLEFFERRWATFVACSHTYIQPPHVSTSGEAGTLAPEVLGVMPRPIYA
jgi:hypothetical protein